MLRKFKINNTQKGVLANRMGIEAEKLQFESPRRNVHIVTFDTDNFEKDTLTFLYNLLGILDSSVYKELNLCREILNTDKEGYARVKTQFITKETEKAIFIWECWIPKSQVIKESEYTYIKEWIFEKNIGAFQL